MSDLVKLDIMSDGTIGLNGTRITRSKMYGIQTVEKSVAVSKKAIIEALGIKKEIYENGYSDGYAKAIDEFAERLKADTMAKTFGLRICDIDRIAEQLKGGTQ